MKLLISPTSLEEAINSIKGGADIIDVKNPQEGSLGGHFPQIIKKIRQIVPDNLKLSAAIGDVSNKPGLVSQAAVGLASCGVEYIKIGLCDSFSIEQAIYLVRRTVEAIKSARSHAKIVVCAYADAKLAKTILPKYIPLVTHKGGADVAMIDTFFKGNRKGLFDYINERGLHKFKAESYDYGLKVALAGGLKKPDILRIKRGQLCDFIGIRTLACRGGKRTGKIEISLVKEIKKLIIN